MKTKSKTIPAIINDIFFKTSQLWFESIFRQNVSKMFILLLYM